MPRFIRWLRTAAVALAVVAVVAGAAIAWIWRERPAVSELGWPVATPTAGPEEGVTVTWLGIATLLFDDGETQILTDGTFTRLSVLDIVTRRRVYSDIAAINYRLAEFRVDRLAAIIPLHAHFDHVMDAGHVANRTSALLLGSESAANIARGADVPVSQYQILADGESRQFGDFTITLIASEHAPIGIGDETWFPGTIEEPLAQPARVSDWRAGVSWSVLIAHTRGTALVQGSAGFIEGKLAGTKADVVFLSVGGLSGLGRKYVRQYWAETVVRTGAARVFPIHFDDYTQSFGTLRLLPELVDDVPATARWLDAPAADVVLQRLPLGRPVLLFGVGPTQAVESVPQSAPEPPENGA
jgi:L-ascorbate metabolism protein UlaG (beta-lactamase superfamily)